MHFEHHASLEEKLKSKKIQLKITMDALSRKERDIRHERDRCDGFDFLFEDSWKQEINAQQKDIEKLETEEIKQLEECLNNQQIAQIQVNPFKK